MLASAKLLERKKLKSVCPFSFASVDPNFPSTALAPCKSNSDLFVPILAFISPPARMVVVFGSE